MDRARGRVGCEPLGVELVHGEVAAEVASAHDQQTGHCEGVTGGRGGRGWVGGVQSHSAYSLLGCQRPVIRTRSPLDDPHIKNSSTPVQNQGTKSHKRKGESQWFWTHHS